ncbi:MAG: hypothetical protein DIJKHBIC_01572 [Thermoanaerobaculia bacterium]|nr:hypothetical protein [Thermoanaerobaculia bacterium]
MKKKSGISKAVLITGCSSGIGHATALRLVKAGYTVYATARRPETLKDLAQAGCKTLALDVNDEASMASAVAAVEKAEGAVGILINNAGYSQSGPIEEIPIERIRKQYETNVFGLVRMCQLVLPGMRRQGYGRIVNIGSMGGVLTFPGGGIYHSTKYAVEAISDALRFEVKGFGVDVVLIQPGLIKTEFSEAAVSSIGAVKKAEGPYGTFTDTVAKATKEAYEKGPLALLGGSGEDVAAVIERALSTKCPKARYRVTLSAHLLMTQRAMLPDGVWDFFLKTQFPQPGRGGANG